MMCFLCRGWWCFLLRLANRYGIDTRIGLFERTNERERGRRASARRDGRSIDDGGCGKRGTT